MQERTCDMPTGSKGNRCAQRVPNDEPFTFGFGGAEYEADLCEKHQNAFATAVKDFTALATESEGGTNSRATKNSGSVRKVLKGKGGVFTTKDVREWLAAQGREVAPSGRLPNTLIEEY